MLYHSHPATVPRLRGHSDPKRLACMQGTHLRQHLNRIISVAPLTHTYDVTLLAARKDSPGQHRMYDTVRRASYWPQMAANAARVVRSGTSGAWNNRKYCKKRNIYHLLANSRLRLVAIIIARRFSKNVQGNQYLLVFTDR